MVLTQPEVWVLEGQGGWREQATDLVHQRAIGLLQMQ